MSSPFTSTRSFQRRIRTTSMRPLSSVSAATAAGFVRASDPRITAAAS
jgi:hypothetical protein